MILVDTSVWIDHLRAGDSTLSDYLNRGSVLSHPFVIGEIALGSLQQRALVLGALQDLPQAVVASNAEVFSLIAEQRLFGLGIGFVDAHLLGAVLLTPGSRLWTRDKRLAGVAEQLGIAARLAH